MKKNKSRERIAEEARPGAYVFDAIVLFVWLLASLICTFTPAIDFLKEARAGSFSADIVLVLLPAIITIVSISLSLPKEKFYGVTAKEFNLLRGYWFYDFLHMVITSCILFLLYTIFSLVKLDSFVVALDFAAFVYCLYFAFQEIPVLTRSSWLIRRVLRRQYKHQKAKDDLYSQQQMTTFTIMVKNLLFSRGITTACIFLNTKNNDGGTEVLTFLLNAQNDFLFETVGDVELEKLSDNDDGLPLKEIVNRGYLNVNEVLSGIRLSKSGSVMLSSKNVYLVARSVFALHQLCAKLGLIRKEETELKELASQSISYGEGKDGLSSLRKSFAITMLALTIGEGETWFVKACRDSSFGYTAIYLASHGALGVFISMMMADVISNGPVKYKDALSSFLKEKDDGLNAIGWGWTQNLQRHLETRNAKEWTSCLLNLVDLYECVPEPTFYFASNEKQLFYNPADNFTRTKALNAWIEVALFLSIHSWDENELMNTLGRLPSQWSEDLLTSLSETWLYEGHLKQGAETQFLDALDLKHYSAQETYFNSSMVSTFEKWRNKRQKEKISSDINQSNPNLDDSKKTINGKLGSVIQSLKNLDESVDLSDDTGFFYLFTCDKIGFEQLLDLSLEQIGNELDSRISKLIEGQATKVSYHLEMLDDDIGKWLDKEKPDCRSKYLSFGYDISDENLLKKLDTLRTLDGLEIPTDCFWKEGAVKANATCLFDKTIVRYCTDAEINEMIEREYQPLESGMYRYQEFEGSEGRYIYCTKKELMDFLKARTIVIRIVLKAKVVVKSSECWVLRKASE